MIMGSRMSTKLLLTLAMLSFTQQSEGTKALLKSLKNLVIDNSRTTATFNSTAFRTLLALLDASKRNGALQNGISFSVSVKGKELKVGTGQTIIFNNVLINDGNGYDDKTGVFTCPVEETYMFVVDSLSPGPTSLHLYLNKTMIASLHVSDYHKNGYLQMSRTVIIKLKKGDNVKVVNHDSSSGALYHEDYSGFTGTKLY